MSKKAAEDRAKLDADEEYTAEIARLEEEFAEKRGGVIDLADDDDATSSEDDGGVQWHDREFLANADDDDFQDADTETHSAVSDTTPAAAAAAPASQTMVSINRSAADMKAVRDNQDPKRMEAHEKRLFSTLSAMWNARGEADMREVMKNKEQYRAHLLKYNKAATKAYSVRPGVFEQMLRRAVDSKHAEKVGEQARDMSDFLRKEQRIRVKKNQPLLNQSILDEQAEIEVAGYSRSEAALGGGRLKKRRVLDSDSE